MELQELKTIYEQYAQEYTAVRKKASPTDGLLGFGADPKKDPCHMRFYEAAEQWVKTFLASGPDADSAYEVAHWLLTAAELYAGKPEHWFMLAAQGLSRELIPMLSREHCAQLEEWYSKTYPRRIRLPVQGDICKLLHKGARK